MKLCNLTMHPHPEQRLLFKHDVAIIGQPLGLDVFNDLRHDSSPNEIKDYAIKMVATALNLGAEAVLIGGLTSLHHHVINESHAKGLIVFEFVSTACRKCAACQWEGKGRIHDCPRCSRPTHHKVKVIDIREVVK